MHLPLQLEVKFSDPSDLSLDLLSLLADLQLLVLHALVHLIEGVSFLVEVAVLLREDLLVIFEEAAEVVELRVLQNLEAVEGGSDLVWRRDFGHLGDGLVQ